MATGDKKRALMTDDLNNAGSGYPVMPLKTVDSSPDASHTDNLISSAAVAAALADKADKTGLTDIFTTGSTNNSGGAIGAGVFFYKDGTLVQAKTAIASGATLTLNTNYEVPTAGALNALKSAIAWKAESLYVPANGSVDIILGNPANAIVFSNGQNNERGAWFVVTALEDTTAGTVFPLISPATLTVTKIYQGIRIQSTSVNQVLVCVYRALIPG